MEQAVESAVIEQHVTEVSFENEQKRIGKGKKEDYSITEKLGNESNATCLFVATGNDPPYNLSLDS